MYKEIDTYDLIDLVNEKKVNLIDVRNNYLFSQGSIKNAKNIPANSLLSNPGFYLDKNNEYYIFCNYGSTSRRICEILTRQGYHVVNVIGGYTAYLKDSN